MALFNYLNRVSWTLDFAASADQAAICVDWGRFAVSHFVDAYWTRAYTGFASATSIAVDYYFKHFPFSPDFSRGLERFIYAFVNFPLITQSNSLKLTSRQFR